MEDLYEADLHCHTNASDGLFSPRELVKLAKQKGLKVIAVTDHDTIGGWVEAERAGKEHGMEIIKGIEVNTEWHEQEVHILGYGIDNTADLSRQLHVIQEKREDRVYQILEKLKQLGKPLTEEDVLRFVKGDSVGRPHIAQAMVEQGYIKTVKEGFKEYLNIGAKAYVPRYILKPEQAIKIIREARGVAVLAHPGDQKVSREVIASWVNYGLQGLEVSHPEHSPEVEEYYIEIVGEMDLLATGGSDFHGEGIKPEISLGKWGASLQQVSKLKFLILKAKAG